MAIKFWTNNARNGWAPQSEADFFATNTVCEVGYVDAAGERVYAHWLLVPAAPANPLATCKNCGYQRQLSKTP